MLDDAAARQAKDQPVSPELARPQAAIDLDKLDLAFGPEHATFEDPTPSVLDGQWHDAATKLDLAKAYQIYPAKEVWLDNAGFYPVLLNLRLNHPPP